MKYIKICPQCGSTNIKMPQAGMDLRLTIRDKCNDCGYIGNFPEVDKDKIKEFRKNIKK
jgi:predicted Zn-ribbon and HTH transcriptional regulator